MPPPLPIKPGCRPAGDGVPPPPPVLFAAPAPAAPPAGASRGPDAPGMVPAASGTMRTVKVKEEVWLEGLPASLYGGMCCCVSGSSAHPGCPSLRLQGCAI
jgi:hypothetical protein